MKKLRHCHPMYTRKFGLDCANNCVRTAKMGQSVLLAFLYEQIAYTTIQVFPCTNDMR